MTTLVYFGAGLDLEPIKIAGDYREDNNKISNINKVIKNTKRFVYIDISPLPEPLDYLKGVEGCQNNYETSWNKRCFTYDKEGNTKHLSQEQEEHNFVQYIIGIFRYKLNYKIRYHHNKEAKCLKIDFGEDLEQTFEYYYSTFLWTDILSRKDLRLIVANAEIFYFHGFFEEDEKYGGMDDDGITERDEFLQVCQLMAKSCKYIIAEEDLEMYNEEDVNQVWVRMLEVVNSAKVLRV
jgi:hypothetical protein